MDAAILIRDLEPWRQARPVWDRAAGMILLAAETGSVRTCKEATRQMHVALERENWWRAPHGKSNH
jgi:glutamine amidotransferase PdxT